MIEIKNIGKKFNKHQLFKDFSYTINEGDFVCIFGESGCGKSTLLNMIGSLEPLDSGDITYSFNNQEYSVLKDSKFIRKNIVSYVFQNFALLNDETVLNNLLFAMESTSISRSEKHYRINEELSKINMNDRAKSYAYELSGGEQQRIALVRAILNPSTVILADEPTGNLDLKNKEIIIEQLKKINESGKTIIVVTHDETFKEVATKTIVLNKDL